MTVAVGDVVRCVAEWATFNSTIAQLVWHIKATSGTTATPVEVGTAARGQLETAWSVMDQIISAGVTGVQIELFQRDAVNHQWDSIELQALTGADGTSGAEMLAHGTSCLVKFITEQARRQARKYIPGLGEFELDNGIFTAAATAAAAAFAVIFDNNIAPGGLIMQFGTYNTDPTSLLYESFSAVTGTTIVEAIPAYQRRRRPGTGI